MPILRGDQHETDIEREEPTLRTDSWLSGRHIPSLLSMVCPLNIGSVLVVHAGRGQIVEVFS